MPKFPMAIQFQISKSEFKHWSSGFYKNIARIPPSSAGGMNGPPSPLAGEGWGEGEMI
jgi:hypothetical protein